MKKISLFLLALICSVATWAQPQAGKYYTLECCSGYAHSTTRFLSDDGTTLSGQNATGTAFTLETTATEGQYYLRSLASGKYVNAAGTTAGKAISLDATASTYWTVDNTNCGETGYALRPNGTANVSLNNNGGTNNLQVWTQTSSSNACSIWQFEQVTGSAYFNFSSSDVTSGSTSAEKTCNDIKVTVTTSNEGGLGSGTTTRTATDDRISSLNSNVKTSLFTQTDIQSFIAAGVKSNASTIATGNLTITISGLEAGKSYNVSLASGLDFEAAGSWNSISSDNTVGSSDPVMGAGSIAVQAAQNITGYIIKSVIADASGNIVFKVNCNGYHTAVINCLGIYKNPNCDYTAMNTALSTAKKYTVGTALNQYTETTSGALATAISTAEAFDQETQTEASLQTDIDNATTALNNAVGGLSLNMPIKGMYMRFKGTSGNYISAATTGTNAPMVALSGNENTTIFQWNADGQMISNTTYTGFTGTHTLSATEGTYNVFTITAGVNVGTYQITSNASGMGTYWYDNTNNGTKLDRNSAAASPYTDWTLEEVVLESAKEGETAWKSKVSGDVYTPTQKAVNTYSTIVLPYNATASGAVLFKMVGKNMDGDAVKSVTFELAGADEASSNELEAGVPYLYRATAETQTFTKTGTEATTVTPVTNVEGFTGSYVDMMLPANNGYYFLNTNGEGKQEFALAGDYIASRAFKCYISTFVKIQETPEAQTPEENARRITLGGSVDETTGIFQLNTNDVKSAADGKFINNGRVVIVKNGKKFNVAGQAVK